MSRVWGFRVVEFRALGLGVMMWGSACVGGRARQWLYEVGFSLSIIYVFASAVS